MKRRRWKPRRSETPPIQAVPEWHASSFTLDFDDRERPLKGGGWSGTIFLTLAGLFLLVSGIVQANLVRTLVGPAIILLGIVLFKLDRRQWRRGR